MATTRFLKLRSDEQPTRAQDNIGAVLDPLAKAVGDTPIMGAPPPPWIRPDYSGDFTDTSGMQQTAYHRDALGYTHLKLAGTSPGGVAGNTAVTTLGLGYRPSETTILVGVNGSTGAINAVSVDQQGVVRTLAALAAGQSVVGYWQFLAVF